MKLKILALLFILCSGQIAFAQRTITGTVNDGGKEMLVGASVVVTGTTKGTLTDVNGGFTLEVPKEATTLTFGYTGYANKTVSIVGIDKLNVSLVGGTALNELVVTAATQKLEAKEFNVSRSGDISKQLAG
jgi:CarboxypepD_reg-like domain